MNTCPKCGLESGQCCTVCDDFGAVRKLGPRAVQRHQNRRKRRCTDPTHGHILDAYSSNDILIQRVIEWSTYTTGISHVLHSVAQHLHTRFFSSSMSQRTSTALFIGRS